MNARNLHFVGRYNTDESKQFADNKLYTKNYLMTRGLGVAKVYLVIKKYKDLKHVDFKSLPASFVIKPNRGYGGEGILVISSHKGQNFIDIDSVQHSWRELYHHMVSILDGKYAISGLFDQVIIEELLEPHDYFTPFLEKGLPDIRIIIFNYVPIVAMLRLPTAQSHGKANLHLGAVGVGIDVVTGKATYAVQYNKFIRKLPNGEKINRIVLPDWDDILLTASKAQHASQIKFLAVDIGLTKTGIKVLELNARAGLGVQIANQIPLKRRLDKVVDLSVASPRKGVEVSKALFGTRVQEENPEKKADKKVIGLFETVDVLNSPYEGIAAKIDPHVEKVLVDKSFSKLESEDRFIDILLQDTRVRAPFEFADLGGSKQKIIIGGKFLQDFLIDPNYKQPTKKDSTKKPKSKSQRVQEKILTNLDKKLTELDAQINILSFVKPLNLNEERQHFLQNQDYSPQFLYKKSDIDYDHFLREIKALPRDIDHPMMPLFIKKIEELLHVLELVEAVGTDEFFQISKKLYKDVENKLYQSATEYIKKNPVEDDESEEFGLKQIIKKLEDFLEESKLSNWKVKIQEKQTSDIAINKNGSILLREGVKFTENRLKAVIIHEICTHIYRLENGRLQPYKIFEQGTAGYLTTEEGLAVYNQKSLAIPMGQKEHWAAFRVIAIHMAKKMSFQELFSFFKEEYGLDDESAWKTCVKTKRGLSDTSQYGGFTRDAVYFRGFLQIQSYLEQHGRRGFKELYVGKIAIDDVEYLKYLGEYKVKHLPPEEIVI